jgi:pimeloyl-ACP methyl ester carboxylesterase
MKRFYRDSSIALTALALCFSGCSSAHINVSDPAVIVTTLSAAGIIDGRSRFRELFCEIRNDHGVHLPDDRPCEEALWRLGDESTAPTDHAASSDKTPRLKLIIVPGIFGECVQNIALPFSDALQHLKSVHGYSGEIITVSGRSSSDHNARQIRDALKNMPVLDGEKLVLIGYSKGTADILHALVTYPEIQNNIHAFVSIAGVVGGSPIADSLLKAYGTFLEHLPWAQCISHDDGEVASITNAYRQSWMSKNYGNLPRTIRYYSIAAFEQEDHISIPLLSGYRTLAKIDPRNDGQVIFSEAVLPGGTLLGYAKADHWAIALPIARNNGYLIDTVVNHNAYPREVLLEAVVRYIEEDLCVTGSASPKYHHLQHSTPSAGYKTGQARWPR